MQIPLLADVDRRVAVSYGALNANHFPNRAIYLIDPEVRSARLSVQVALIVVRLRKPRDELL